MNIGENREQAQKNIPKLKKIVEGALEENKDPEFLAWVQYVLDVYMANACLLGRRPD